MAKAGTIQAADMAKRENRFSETVSRYGKRLLAFIRQRVPTSEDAEDIAQEVWYQWARLTSPDAILQEDHWLFRVAGNKVRDFYRKRRELSLADQQGKEEDGDGPLYLEDILPDYTPLPDEEFAFGVMMDALEEALGELPPEQRQVFIWHEIEGKSFKEIAVLSGLSVNTLLSRKRYAILHLREALREVYNEMNNL